MTAHEQEEERFDWGDPRITPPSFQEKDPDDFEEEDKPKTKRLYASKKSFRELMEELKNEEIPF